MFVNELKQRILDFTHIEEVIGEYVTLKKQGSNLLGLCPFHNEKTPSFTVTPNKGIFKCFGCGEGGDVISFIMKIDKLSYPDAITFLGKRIGIEVKEEEKQKSPEEEKAYKERESLYIINQWAKDWFALQLSTDEGKAIGAPYFKERGLTAESIVEFGLGYCPTTSDALSNAAKAAGHNLEKLEALGLVISGNYGKPFDRFKERVMFPFFSINGRILGFGGRTLKSDKQEAKYLNSPESLIYKKSETLYGLFQAKKQIRQVDEVILVEGYLDVISLHQAGIKHAVASSGTSLTQEQARLLHRFSENVLLLYDGDAAGIKAAVRGLDILVGQNLNVKVCLLPQGEDPDSFVKKQGGSVLKDFIQVHSQYFIDFKAEMLFQQAGNDPLLKVQSIRELAATLTLVSDPLKRSAFITRTAQRWQIDEKLFLNEINKQRGVRLQKSTNKVDTSSATSNIDQEIVGISIKPELADAYQEKDIIRILVLFGSYSMPIDEDEPLEGSYTVADEIFSQLTDLDWEHPLYKKIYDFIFESHLKGEKLGRIQLLHQADRSISDFISEVMSNQPEISKNWEKKHEILVRPIEENFVNDLISGLARFKLNKTTVKLKALNSTLEKSKNWDEQLNLLKQIQELQIQKKYLAQIIGSVIIQ